MSMVLPKKAQIPGGATEGLALATVRHADSDNWRRAVREAPDEAPVDTRAGGAMNIPSQSVRGIQQQAHSSLAGWILVATLILGALVGFYLLSSREVPAGDPAPPAASFGVVGVSTNAPRARVLFDGQFMGIAGPNAWLARDMPTGLHTVRVESEGWQAEETEVYIEDGRTTHLRVTLEPTVVPARTQPSALTDALARSEQPSTLVPSVRATTGPDPAVEEVTVRGFERCLADTQCADAVRGGYLEAGTSQCRLGTAELDPQVAMNCLSHSAASAYCFQNGMGLPTQAEWEELYGRRPGTVLWHWTSTASKSGPPRFVVRGVPLEESVPHQRDEEQPFVVVRASAMEPYLGAVCVGRP